jgi:hypothetical protein
MWCWKDGALFGRGAAGLDESSEDREREATKPYAKIGQLDGSNYGNGNVALLLLPVLGDLGLRELYCLTVQRASRPFCRSLAGLSFQ